MSHGSLNLSQLMTQQNANASPAPNNINAQQQASLNDSVQRVHGSPTAEPGTWYVNGQRPMTASDLGIVDQLLDDKVGMEP